MCSSAPDNPTWSIRRDWRRQFGQATPVLIVQLPGFGSYQTQPQPSDWAQLREAGRRVVAATPRAGLAVTIDIGSTRFLHPTDKQDVRERLALLARTLIYRQSVIGVSPSRAGLMWFWTPHPTPRR